MNLEGRAGKSLYTGCVSPCRTGRNCAFAIFCVYNNGTSFEDKRKIAEQRKKRAHTKKENTVGAVFLRDNFCSDAPFPVRERRLERRCISSLRLHGVVFTHVVYHQPGKRTRTAYRSLHFRFEYARAFGGVFCRSLESSGTGQIWCGAWTYIADRDQAY